MGVISALGLGARGTAAQEVVPPAPAAKGATAPEKTPPSAEELAPIVIPASSALVTSFAIELDKACRSLVNDTGIQAKLGLAVGAASSLRAAIEAAKDRTEPPFQHLKQTCIALGKGTLTPDEDWKNLEAFRSDPDPATLAAAIVGPAATPSGLSPEPLTSAGSFAEDVIEGLAKFLYDRAKAQASLYLGARLREKLCSADTRPFFPNVCVALEDVDLNLPVGAIGTYFIAAARKDLEQFPDTALVYALHALVEPGINPTQLVCSSARQPACNALFGARLGLTYYRAVASGRKPLDVVRGLHEVKLSHDPAPAVFEMVRNGSALVDAVSTQRGWQQLPASDTQLLACYTVAVYLSLQESVGGRQLPPDIRLAMQALPPLVKLLSQLIHRADGAFDAVAAQAGTGAGAGAGDAPLPAGVTPDPAPAATSGQLSSRDYVVTATQMLQVATDVRSSEAFGFPTSGHAAHSRTLHGAAALGESIAARVDAVQTTLLAFELLRQLTTMQVESDTLTAAQLAQLQAMQRLIPLLTQLASAKSADEAANVFQAAAVSVNTYALKYEKPMVVLNGLVGAAAGSELVSVESQTRASGMAGGFAPVGFHATTPSSNGHWHFGAMLSVIDLGALVTARFQSEMETSGPASARQSTTVPKDPDIHFANLVSPGFFLTLGIDGSPFVLGGGARLLPARTTESVAADGTTSTSSTPAFQIVGLLAVDVPILQL